MVKDKKEIDRLIGSKILLSADQEQQIQKNKLIKDDRMSKAVLNHGYNTIFKPIYSSNTKMFSLISRIIHNPIVDFFDRVLNKIILRNNFILPFLISNITLCFLYILFVSFYIITFSVFLLSFIFFISIIVAIFFDIILTLVDRKK